MRCNETIKDGDQIRGGIFVGMYICIDRHVAILMT